MEKELGAAYSTLITGSFVHTEVIKQHDLINQIHSNSINTLRIITLITETGNIEIITTFIRFGVGDSVVDNSSSGGFFVGVNIEAGTLQTYGHFFPEYGGQKITAHPDSGFEFKGFKIPYYEEACQLVITGAKTIPNKLIGWDIAITPQGPVIIETNSKPNIQGCNIINNGLLKNKHIKKLIEKLK